MYKENIRMLMGRIEWRRRWKSLHYLKICGLSPKFLEKCEYINLAQPKILRTPLDGFNINSGSHDVEIALLLIVTYT